MGTEGVGNEEEEKDESDLTTVVDVWLLVTIPTSSSSCSIRVFAVRRMTALIREGNEIRLSKAGTASGREMASEEEERQASSREESQDISVLANLIDLWELRGTGGLCEVDGVLGV